MTADQLKQFIREVPDFPKPGILFRDITPVLSNGEALRASAQHLAAPFREAGIDQVLGIESRGFIFGALVAAELGCGFIPVRKPGKLPAVVLRRSYALEYGEDAVEMHADAIASGQRVAIVDDVIATGGTARAAIELAEQAGATVEGIAFLVELEELAGREVLGDRPIHSVLRY
jgi:adenine phosphoribosyltransferase